MDNGYIDSAGSVRISEDVVATIASVAAAEVEGVVTLVTMNSKDIKNIISGKKGNTGRVVKIELMGGELNVSIGIIVAYGYKMQEVIANIQSEVKHAIESMTSMMVHSVNIHVLGVDTAKKAPVEAEVAE